ncbi:fmp52, mitochondrial [Acrasis kona]|uniref:Fmp52, mitochondrial n=1 Tax=Acrasis kona TaxID=1008807 RepID=A0AAW2Z4J6_9EUKA
MIATLVGSTGLVGRHILTSILDTKEIKILHSITRRPPKVVSENDRLRVHVIPESSKWAEQILKMEEPTQVFFSGLGTTRADAGGFDEQYKIDYLLNLELAKAAKKSGASTYVLISSSGADSKSYFAYPRMKGELEDAVINLGFKKTVIVRPGIIVGDRERKRFFEQPLHYIANGVGWISPSFKNSFAQDADVIARAAVKAALDDREGVVRVNQTDIISLGQQQ